jgi:putative nucleotidyltransferase with HDIG domain
MSDSSSINPQNNKHGVDAFLQTAHDEIIQFQEKIPLSLDFHSTNDTYSAFLEASQALVQSLEKRDPCMAGHTKRVVFISETIARYLHLPPEEKEKLKIAALLHDIGKIGIKEEILAKEGKLTASEYNAIQQHPLIGVAIIGKNDQLKDVIPGMCYHHERTDGNGYPEGLKDTNIPLLARIIAVADAYDAMTTNRPYQKALSKDGAISEIKRCSGIQFDQEVVQAFIQAYNNDEIDTIP